MPIHELGYRHWDGAVRPRWLRWASITRTGIPIALRPKLVKRLCFLAIVPAFYFGPLFFALGVLTDPDNDAIPEFWRNILGGMLDGDIQARLRQDPSQLREPVWNDIFRTVNTFGQIFSSLLITTTVAPALISRDLRSKAFLIYFSKPITRIDYVLGKAGVIAAYLAWFTLLPSLVIYTLSIVFAPTADALSQTAPVIPKILAAGLLTIIPLTSVSLFISSVTRDERVATFVFAAVVLAGWFAHKTLTAIPEFQAEAWINLLSIWDTIWVAVDGIYGPATLPTLTTHNADETQLAYIFLASITVGSLWGLWRNVSAPLRI